MFCTNLLVKSWTLVWRAACIFVVLSASPLPATPTHFSGIDWRSPEDVRLLSFELEEFLPFLDSPQFSPDGWGSGIIATRLSTNSDVVRTSVLQDDGKLVVGGRINNGTYNEFILVRFDPDGDMDSTFGTNGITQIDLGDEAIIHGLAIDNGGNIVAVGRGRNVGDWQFGMARVYSDGAIDTNFMTANGFGYINFGGNDFARDVAIDSQNRILVAGYSDTAGNYDFAVARTSSNGTFDASFGTGGLVTTPIGATTDVAYSVLIESNDRVVLAGKSNVGANPNIAVARYRTDGSLDATFSGDGIDTWALGGTAAIAWDAALGTANRIHIAGRAFVGGSNRMAIAVYDSDGTQADSGSYAIGSGAVARSIYYDGNKHTLGGKTYDGTDWNFAIIRTLTAPPGFARDTSFSGDGVATSGIGATDDMAYSVAVQTDGKVVLAGGAYGSDSDFGIMRFNENGTTDSFFGTNGAVTTDLGANNADISYGVEVQSDNRVIAVGYSDDGTNNDFALVRYLSSGSLDTSFSTDGLLTVSIASGNASANDVLIDSSGRYYVVGVAHNGSNSDFAVTRFLTNGSLDNTFSGDGELLTDFNSADDAAHAVALDASGRLLVAGYAGNGTNKEFAVARYLTNGTLDAAFSGDGRATAAFAGSSDDVAFALSLQSDGNILLGGHSHNSANTDFAIARFLTNGSLDANFDGDGLATATIDATHGSQMHALVWQTDGDIFAGGRILSISNQAVVARFNSDGSLDVGFDSDGIQTLAFTTNDRSVNHMVFDHSGRIVLAGSGIVSNFDFVAVRFAFGAATTLSLDSSFDSDGIVTTAITTADDFGNTLAYSDGTLVLGGFAINGGARGFGLVRYNIDGSLAASGARDSSFGSSGTTVTAFSGANHDLAFAVAIQPDGKAVVAGKNFDGTHEEFAIARYGTDGTLDTSFDTDGMVTTSVGAADDAAFAVGIDGNGRIVAGGYAENGGNREFALARYDTDGSLDNTFSGDGLQTTAVIGTSDDVIYTLGIQADNKIIVGGHSHNAVNNHFALAKYNTNGTLDGGFNGTGLVTTEIDTGAGNQLHALTLQADNKIIAAGRTYGPDNEIAVLRYNTNGSLDNTFSGDGIATISATSGDDVGYAVTLDNNQRVIVAGHSYASNYDFGILRFYTDGSLDSTFDTDGIAEAAVGTLDDAAYGIISQPNGKYVSVGYSQSGGRFDMALTRHKPDGSLDSDFGTGGVTTLNLGNDSVASAIALLSNGRMIVVGYSKDSGSDYDFTISRFWP